MIGKLKAHNNKGLIVNCKHCKQSFNCSPSDHRKFCSRKCFHAEKKEWVQGEKHPMWNGGVFISLGYKRLYTKQMEHRYIMEQHLGRKLTKQEIIHHLDGDKKNNNINNLIVISRSDHIRLHRKELYATC